MKTRTGLACATALALACGTSPAFANDNAVQLVRCEQSLGTVAFVDGANAGWSQWNLGSPRALLMRLATESGCFTPHSGGNEPARFLMTAIAGTQEEVDQGVELARGAATEALVRSGAASSVLRSVPFGGAALGMLGGLGGRRTTVAAGLTVVSPANGQPLATGSGSVTRSSLTFRGNNGSWARDVAGTTGYANSSEGQRLTEAFILAFNQIVGQNAALAAAPQPGAAAAAPAAAPGATTAVATVMRAGPAESAAEVRDLRAGTALKLTGNREGLWIEAEDNFGTRGWVSVEDLQ
ncbi:SH3 domain-containing protein [Altererythrobacter lauratis]|uniref:SH3 domain-containing protein n=1 Tax=Alteraurantiacibacter lauratis TaxID=2054627 RepID=A0ABV7EAV3_9SPHN